MMIVGLDPSLTSTGIATWRDGEVTIQKIETSGAADATLLERHRRLHNLRLDIGLACHGADVVLIEGPSHGAPRQRGTFDRNGLWWLVVDWFGNYCSETAEHGRKDATGVPIVEVPPATLKKYATGNGSAGKEAMLVAAVRRFPDVPVNTNDEADAMWLLAIGCQHLGQSIVEVPKVNLTFLSKIEWPESVAGLVPA